MGRVFGASAERVESDGSHKRSGVAIEHRPPKAPAVDPLQPWTFADRSFFGTPTLPEHVSAANRFCPTTTLRTQAAHTWPLDRVTWSGSARGMGPAQRQLHVSGPSPHGVPEDAERTLTRITPVLACQHQLLGRRARCVAPSATQRTRRTETRGVLRLREYTTALMAVILPSALIQPCCTQRR